MNADDDSAQMLLIAGFAIGVSIAVFTVMLNNIIYASNMASESSIETSPFEIGNVLKLTSQAYENAYNSAMNAGTFDSNVFMDYLSSYENQLVKMFAFSGKRLTIENSTLIDAYFSKNGMINGMPNWTLISNVNFTDTFILEIPKASKLSNNSSCLRFEAVETNGSMLWAMDIYDSGGYVNVRVMDNNSTLGNTTSASGYVYLNITGNYIDGTSYFNFHFNDLTSSHVYHINVINGTAGAGIFRLSGNHVDGHSFNIARHAVVLANISVVSFDKKMFISYPIPVPGGIA